MSFFTEHDLKRIKEAGFKTTVSKNGSLKISLPGVDTYDARIFCAKIFNNSITANLPILETDNHDPRTIDFIDSKKTNVIFFDKKHTKSLDSMGSSGIILQPNNPDSKSILDEIIANRNNIIEKVRDKIGNIEHNSLVSANSMTNAHLSFYTGLVVVPNIDSKIGIGEVMRRMNIIKFKEPRVFTSEYLNEMVDENRVYTKPIGSASYGAQKIESSDSDISDDESAPLIRENRRKPKQQEKKNDFSII